MNHTNFMTWVRTTLFQIYLPPQAVLVIDHASYHNVKINKDPTRATKKNDIISWLVRRNITHDPRKTKPELYELITYNITMHRLYPKIFLSSLLIKLLIARVEDEDEDLHYRLFS
jgi:hypothetical protein